MSPSATPTRSSAVRRKKPATPGPGTKKAARTATKAVKPTGRGAKTVARAAKSASGGSGSPVPTPGKLGRTVAKKAAKKAAKTMVHKTVAMGASAVRRAADRAAVAGRNAYESGTSKMVPIQLSIDVAVPIHVAWEEWRAWGSLPEGVHRIEDVERDGDALIGRTAGPRRVDWEAEIKDEREDESFAWLSTAGTDVAGLATFHSLSERLTRIELDLDVVPTNPSEALAMALHVAHRHAEADLRRFKAHVEFISPDAYEEHLQQNGHSTGRRGKRSARNPRQQSGRKP
jgi:uncharacterized membrane protein